MFTRSLAKSYCTGLDRKGQPLPPCPVHPGRPSLCVRYNRPGFSGEGWADDEAEADKLAREALRAKLEKRASELRREAEQLEEEARFLTTV